MDQHLIFRFASPLRDKQGLQYDVRGLAALHCPADDMTAIEIDDDSEIGEASQVRSGVISADALLLPEPYVHLSAHTALHSSLAHGHSNVMVVRRDGTAVFKPEDVWVSLRIAPPELRLGA